MTRDEARTILSPWLQADGSLTHDVCQCGVWVSAIRWYPGDLEIDLDCTFTVSQLRALAVWITPAGAVVLTRADAQALLDPWFADYCATYPERGVAIVGSPGVEALELDGLFTVLQIQAFALWMTREETP